MAGILITGCSSGFGELAAREFSRTGHRVFATMRGTDGRNQGIAEELSRLENVTVHELDVTNEESIAACAEEILAQSALDVIVHNAGFGVYGVAEGSTPEQFSRVLEVNLLGVHRLNRAFLPHLRSRRSGLLIYLSSGSGRTVFPYSSVYCASKFALEAYAEALAYELRTFDIDSVILEPGAYPSRYRQNVERPDDGKVLAQYPVEQAEAEKIHANIVEMLHSEMAPDPRDITNAMLHVLSLAPGERPLRVALRKDAGGLKMINQICGEVQGALLRGLNLEHRTVKRPQL